MSAYAALGSDGCRLLVGAERGTPSETEERKRRQRLTATASRSSQVFIQTIYLAAFRGRPFFLVLRFGRESPSRGKSRRPAPGPGPLNFFPMNPRAVFNLVGLGRQESDPISLVQ